ncbi:uncharacterized protein EV420DRAFT_1484726 [Desarmillaria tabescens]|uniref:Uncharacterized protein n=1 Tax=Armillaria tabescens TaxID=1929756 RepID=A0AA39JK53_ARMTA|nr:uncharacterized protein EV420DRAFT_1484726 [Desarmillaria tabescens]KAK0444235.1 hypothetical protein EV420DRAFT_1484726 [Desarmillaria tabescens]
MGPGMPEVCLVDVPQTVAYPTPNSSRTLLYIETTYCRPASKDERPTDFPQTMPHAKPMQRGPDFASRRRVVVRRASMGGWSQDGEVEGIRVKWGGGDGTAFASRRRIVVRQPLPFGIDLENKISGSNDGLEDYSSVVKRNFGPRWSTSNSWIEKLANLTAVQFPLQYLPRDHAVFVPKIRKSLPEPWSGGGCPHNPLRIFLKEERRAERRGLRHKEDYLSQKIEVSTIKLLKRKQDKANMGAGLVKDVEVLVDEAKFIIGWSK